MTPTELTAQMQALLGERLVSVVLYGSAAAGDFVPGASDYNVLVVLQTLNVAELDLLHQPLQQWHAAGNPAPLLFTTTQLFESADAFPIELLDIQQSRRTLLGRDVLGELQIRPMHLRLQVERELTGKLLRLRGKYALAAQNPAAISELMIGSLSTFLVLFRAALRLYQGEVPDKKIDALHALTKHIAFDAKPLERLLELKQVKAHDGRVLSDVPFAEYLAAIEAVLHEINYLVRN